MTRRLGPALVLAGLAAGATPITLHAQADTARRAAADSGRPAELQAIEVIGSPAALRRIPGSGALLTVEQLTLARLLSTGEALRKVPGIHVREEEGAGLRPNIGIRGLNPNRSSTVLLLEDGLPMTIAPYGDNAAYYHPPVDRFARIEVLKGSGQILFGPRTIGGVINYITPDAPIRPRGRVLMAAGSDGYRLGKASFGGTWDGARLLVDAMRKQGDGSRQHTGTELADLNLKAGLALGAAHTLTLKANHYLERTNATYAGLTEAEYAANPRYNPFRNDSLFLRRTGLSGTVRSALGGSVLTTTVYSYGVSRDWWRQANSSTDRPLDRADPACGGMDNLDTTCGIQGGLRSYLVWGVEPRFAFERRAGGTVHTVEVGARFHAERQERTTVGGAFPTSRTPGPASDPGSGISEDNLRHNRTYAAWIQDRIGIGPWTISPGLRLERVGYRRTNRLPLADHPAGVTGTSSLLQLIPGLGITRSLGPSATVYAGVHRGFAPPRTEDLISNSTGGVVELDAELSWNTEFGVRVAPATWVSGEVTLFRMDFQNQIVPANLAGGAGATLTSAGRTLHRGVETTLALDGAALGGVWSAIGLSLAHTWLPTARYEDARFAWIGTGAGDVPGKVYAAQNAAGTRQRVSVSGNRLPYAPEHLLTVGLALRPSGPLALSLEAVHTGAQFSDAANTVVLVPDGQQGPIPAATWWNATANVDLPGLRGTLFLAAKNLFGRTYIVDRSRGLLPGPSRSVQLGLTTGF